MDTFVHFVILLPAVWMHLEDNLEGKADEEMEWNTLSAAYQIIKSDSQEKLWCSDATGLRLGMMTSTSQGKGNIIYPSQVSAENISTNLIYSFKICKWTFIIVRAVLLQSAQLFTCQRAAPGLVCRWLI